MKYLTIFFLFLSLDALAYPVPKELEKAQIEVKTRDGVTHKFNASEYKVVKRSMVKKSTTVIKSVVRTPVPKPLKNRITLLGGISPSGKLSQTFYTDRVKISTKTAPVFGISYDRKFDNFVVRGEILSNKTYMIGLGVEF